jgi:hypothetical protein
MRHHYGASGYTDPHAAYESACKSFADYWESKPEHLRTNFVYRAIAREAFLVAMGWNLGGQRRDQGQ